MANRDDYCHTPEVLDVTLAHILGLSKVGGPTLRALPQITPGQYLAPAHFAARPGIIYRALCSRPDPPRSLTGIANPTI